MYKKTKNKKSGYCLVCFKSLFENTSIKTLIKPNKYLCDECKNKFVELNQYEYIFGVKVKYLFEYNQFMKDLIYQYKGCYDVILKDVFLERHKKEIRKKYKKYLIVFPPSNSIEDKKRGFNHIEKTVECLHINSEYLFYKTKEIKQSSLKYKERQGIENIIKVRENKTIDSSKKYLIVDDIVTTKSTLKAIIKLLINNGVNKNHIEAIIIAKKKDFVEL